MADFVVFAVKVLCNGLVWLHQEIPRTISMHLSMSTVYVHSLFLTVAAFWGQARIDFPNLH